MQKLKLRKVDNKTYVELDSLLASLRQRGYTDIADRIERAASEAEDKIG